jgi:hypothetical protein
MLDKLDKHFENEQYNTRRVELGLSTVGLPRGDTGRGGRVTAGLQTNDGICKYWKQTGYCRNYTENGNCSYSHPEDQKAILKGKGKGKDGKGKKGKGKGKDGKGKGKGKDGKGKGKDKGKKSLSENDEWTLVQPKAKAWPKAKSASGAPKRMYSCKTDEYCRAHTKNGKCEGPNFCGLFHNPTCVHWETHECSLGSKCPFPHRSDVKSKGPKGTTYDANGKMHLPSYEAPTQGKAQCAISMHLAGSDDGRDDNEE